MKLNKIVVLLLLQYQVGNSSLEIIPLRQTIDILLTQTQKLFVKDIFTDPLNCNIW